MDSLSLLYIYIDYYAGHTGKAMMNRKKALPSRSSKSSTKGKTIQTTINKRQKALRGREEMPIKDKVVCWGSIAYSGLRMMAEETGTSL